ncbi:MAG: hypothetical protein K0R15_625 [Clostridiales bacterium]|jgi:uncharacterized coiled-coil DUF342 family protein|nr:hypothetical protein [Clostridiales bacterium]
MAYDIGAKIGIEGEAEYRQSIRNINSTMKTLGSEMKLVTSEFDGQANSVEALKRKNDVLNKQTDEQKKKLTELTKGLEESTKKYGENDKVTQSWQQSVNNASAELNKMEKELRNNSKYLNEAVKSTDGMAKSIDEFGKEAKTSKGKVEGFNEEIAKVKEGTKDFAKIVGGAFVGVISGIVAVSEKTKEYRNDFAKLEQNAKTAGANINDVSGELKNLDAITGETDSNIEALSNLMKAGFTGSNLQTAVENLSGAVIQFPDTMKIEGLSDGLQETLATGKAIGPFSELLERLGYNLDDFNKGLANCTTEADRQKYALDVLAKTGLSKVNDGYRKNNEELIKNSDAQFELREKMSDIARTTAPLMNRAMGALATGVGDLAKNALPILVDGLDWIMDNGDTIATVVGGIGAGVATLKVGTGIKGVVDSIKSIGTESDGSKSLFGGLTTALTGNPVAMAAIAVGTITAAILLIKNATEETKSETDLYLEKVDAMIVKSQELNTTIKDGIDNRKENKEDIENEFGAYKNLADELLALNEVEEKTNGQKAIMKSLIDELNKSIPEMNLSIDEGTGYLNLQADEIHSLISAQEEYYKVVAAQEDMTKIYKEKYESEKTLAELTQARMDLMVKLEEVENRKPEDQWDENINLDDMNKYLDKIDEVDKQINTVNKSIGLLDEEVLFAKTIIEESTNESGNNVKGFGEATTKASDEAIKALDTLKKSFEDQAKTAKESIESQIKLFDKFNDEVKYSNDEILANLESQITGVQNWSSNLAELAKKGIDEGLLKELRDMGPESAQYVSALVTMTDTQVQELNSLWTEKFVVADIVSKEVAEAGTGYQRELRKMQTGGDRIIGEWQAIGANLAKGFGTGFQDEFAKVRSRVGDSIGGLKSMTENVLQIKSPSRVFAEIGSYTAEGFGIGFTDEMKAVTQEINKSIPRNLEMSGNYSLNTSKSNNITSPTIDYALLANAVVNGIARAGLKVEMNREIMGEVISDTIRKEVYS